MTTDDQTKTTLEQAFETIRDHAQDALTELHRIVPGALEEYTPTDRWAKLPDDVDMPTIAEYAEKVRAWKSMHADSIRSLRIMGDVHRDMVDKSNRLLFTLSEKFEKLALND